MLQCCNVTKLQNQSLHRHIDRLKVTVYEIRNIRQLYRSDKGKGRGVLIKKR